jgi:cytochrome c biogenesis protein CcmG/thiol:disulfide interchange protein DsbE
MLRRTLSAVLVAALVVVPSCEKKGPATMPPSMQSALLGQPVPELSRPSLAGGQIDVTTMRGKIVVVKFFAEYCEPCKVTLPEAQSLSVKQTDVVFVGVSEDEYEQKARDVVAQYGLSFPIVHDRGNVLAGRFRVHEMPATFVVDTTGVIRWVGGPGQAEGDLAKAISAVRG